LNKRQLSVIRHFLVVIIVTLLFIFGMVNLRDGLNRSEMQREMENLAASIKNYRQKNNSLPPESWIQPQLEGFARLSGADYRAKFVFYDSPPDTIIASCKQKSYSMLVKTAYIVLRLDGRIEWLSPEVFDKAMKEQEEARQLELYRLYGVPATK
jgi:hypothetical protein